MAERGGKDKDTRVAKTAMRGAMQTAGFAERFMKVAIIFPCYNVFVWRARFPAVLRMQSHDADI